MEIRRTLPAPPRTAKQS